MTRSTISLPLLLTLCATGTAQVNIATLTDSAAGFGSAIATGDLDGDGLTDLAVGAPSAALGVTVQGRVRVYLSSGPIHDLWPSGNGIAGAEFGFALDIGDLDNMPGDELVVGAPGQLNQAGSHYVFTAPPASGTWDPVYNKLDGTHFPSLTGDRLGASVTIYPHPEFTGARAWAVGGPGGNMPGGLPGEGYVDVHDGTTFAVRTSVGPVQSTINTCTAGSLTLSIQKFGYGKRVLGGDFDGDGLGDLAVLAGARWGKACSAGICCDGGSEVFVYNSTGVAPYYAWSSTPTIRESGGTDDMDIVRIGDVDGDANNDDEWVLLSWTGTPYVSVIGGSAAMVRDYPGANPSSIRGTTGDVDADGITDIVVSFTGAFGFQEWLASEPSTGTLYQMQKLAGVAPAPLAMGDWNADGWADLFSGGSGQVSVESPADPAKALTVFNDSVSIADDERVVFFLNGTVLAVTAGEKYGLLSSDQVPANPGEYFSYCGLTFDLKYTGVMQAVINNPTLFIEPNHVAFDPSGRATGRKSYPLGVLDSTLIGVSIHHQYGTYLPPFQCQSASNRETVTITP